MYMIYHRYMAANYEQVFTYIKKKYGEGDDLQDLPSKDDHEKNARKFSLYTIFCAGILIILNFFR